MAWKGESWEELVARAARTERRTRAEISREDAAALAARAEPWPMPIAQVELEDEGLRLGDGMHSVRLGFVQVYHLEPVDPWPSLAVGWVDGPASFRAILTPQEEHAEAFAAAVDDVVSVCEAEIPRATHRGWLAVPDLPWERVGALPSEGDEPSVGGYREAPGQRDPILATRRITAPFAGLIGWLVARLGRAPRRVQPRVIELTKRYLYVRAVDGATLRLPAESLRDARRNEHGDTVYVFGRSTELLVVQEPGCALTPILDARL